MSEIAEIVTHLPTSPGSTSPVFLPPVTPLPGTRREVEAIAALFPESRKLLGSAAKGAAVRQVAADGSLGKFDVLHLATHGITDPFTAFQSSIILSQTPEDNGKVTALEMKDWKLNAELVVLSACESGLGLYSGGDGYLGFTQALFLANTRSVALSLWQVDDTATSLLMVRFYQNLLGKRPDALGALTQPRSPMPKAEALREAKHWLRNLTAKEIDQQVSALPCGSAERPLAPPSPAAKHPRPFEHPHYWAGFILVGDPN